MHLEEVLLHRVVPLLLLLRLRLPCLQVGAPRLGGLVHAARVQPVGTQLRETRLPLLLLLGGG